MAQQSRSDKVPYRTLRFIARKRLGECARQNSAAAGSKVVRGAQTKSVWRSTFEWSLFAASPRSENRFSALA